MSTHEHKLPPENGIHSITLTLRKTLTVLVSIIVTILLLEVALRILEKVTDNDSLVPKQTTLTKYFDHDLGPRYTPNQSGWFYSQTKEYQTFVSFNSDGWHDVDHTKEKSSDTYRILILGDSFVESMQVPLEETFFRKLEKSLNEHGGQKVEIIALGLSDTGPAQQLAILDTYGLSFNPDLVIQMFLTANDIRNSSPEMQYNRSIPYYTLSENGSLSLIPPNEIRPKSRTSFLYSLRITRIINKALNNYRLFKQSAMQDDYHMDLHVYDQNYSDLYKRGWSLTERIIVETKQHVESTGSDYMLVTLANNEQLNDNVWKYYLTHNPAMQKALLDRDKPEKIVQEMCQKHAISCSFMLPTFRDYIQNTGQSTHYPFDGHWNETGHSVAATFLYKTVSDHLSQIANY